MLYAENIYEFDKHAVVKNLRIIDMHESVRKSIEILTKIHTENKVIVDLASKES